jgi:predicted Fe-Mo cluster-binding NifX family protein
MKVAIATEGMQVAEHFGQSCEDTLNYENNGQIESQTKISNPGHKPGFLPGYLSSLGVTCIIAGGMGPKAQELFAEKNIVTIIGVTGLVDEVIREYLAGRLVNGESFCDHHQGSHGNCGQC